MGVENIYAEGGISHVHHIEQAMRAYALFKRDRDYVIENNSDYESLKVKALELVKKVNGK